MAQIATVALPDIGEGVVEGEVVEWLKKVGDRVDRDEPVVIVMTDKASVELPAPYPGVLKKQYYSAGETAVKDLPLYDLEVEEDEKIKEHIAPKSNPKFEKKKKKPAKVFSAKVLAAPAVRRVAREMEIDLQSIQGSGRDGRILLQDLKQASQPTAAIKRLKGDQEIPLVGIRGMMAQKMAESKQSIPHFSYFEKVDATRLLQLHSKVKNEGEQEGIHITFMPYFLRAMSLTINEFPELNSSLDQKTLLLHQSCNIGVAMSTDQGLIVPVLKNVQEMSFEQIVRSYEDLKTKAHKQELTPEDMREGTVTISNFGVFGRGGVWATPIINPPEAAILAVNRIQQQPVVKQNHIEISPLLDLSWSFDHRVIDGSLASTISHHFAKLIENPALLL